MCWMPLICHIWKVHWYQQWSVYQYSCVHVQNIRCVLSKGLADRASIPTESNTGLSVTTSQLQNKPVGFLWLRLCLRWCVFVCGPTEEPSIAESFPVTLCLDPANIHSSSVCLFFPTSALFMLILWFRSSYRPFVLLDGVRLKLKEKTVQVIVIHMLWIGYSRSLYSLPLLPLAAFYAWRGLC